MLLTLTKLKWSLNKNECIEEIISKRFFKKFDSHISYFHSLLQVAVNSQNVVDFSVLSKKCLEEISNSKIMQCHHHYRNTRKKRINHFIDIFRKEDRLTLN